jgi:hypothetical protein
MSKDFTEIARGLVIRQSMVGEVLPEMLTQFVVAEHAHLLGGTEPVDVLVLECRDCELWPLLEVVAQQMKPSRYYAHFVSGSIMYVVFPSCIVLVSRNDKATAQRAREIGSIFSIPDERMKFEQLFEMDHPNVPT